MSFSNFYRGYGLKLLKVRLIVDTFARFQTMVSCILHYRRDCGIFGIAWTRDCRIASALRHAKLSCGAWWREVAILFPFLLHCKLAAIEAYVLRSSDSLGLLNAACYIRGKFSSWFREKASDSYFPVFRREWNQMARILILAASKTASSKPQSRKPAQYGCKIRWEHIDNA